MPKKNKVLAILVTIMIVASILLSLAFVVKNAQHNCTGTNDCPICMELEAAMQTISGMKVLPAIAFCMVVLCVFTQLDTSQLTADSIKNTLITLKVELII